MVLSILGTVVDKCPESLDQLHQQFVHLRDGVSMLGRGVAHPVDSSRSLYVAANEFAVVYDMDSSVDIVGTDTIGSSVLIILRSSHSCSTLVCHASNITASDMDMMVSSINTTNMRCNYKDKHNIIYEPRENQQRHDGYYTIEGTVQHGQFVKSDMQMHCGAEGGRRDGE